jgi:hypothetical protein
MLHDKQQKRKKLLKLIQEAQRKKGRIFLKEENGVLKRFCILCDAIIEEEEPCLDAIWIEPDFKRTMYYFVCSKCEPKLRDEKTNKKTIKGIEEKLMLITASIEKAKAT